MRDWLENTLSSVLRHQAERVKVRPFTLEQVRYRARRLAIGNHLSLILALVATVIAVRLLF